ncbi:MAG: FkbM family methyltransferase [Parachlamydia sp.]|nr:FkbM family methyltransferase [Parachlamydia sp.]
MNYLIYLIFLSFFSICSAEIDEQEAEKILGGFHSELSLLEGTFNEEYPEQVMAVMFIQPHDKVLEIGGNIGRNSCIISKLLNNSNNLVVAESNPAIAEILISNRDRNGLEFHVENSAISKVPLIQAGWATFPQDSTPEGFFKVQTMTYSQLKEKYGIPFNVMVADCEGALYYILRDDESLLEDFNLLIIENDYHERAHFEEVVAKFESHGFHNVYTKSGGWGPCYNEFYQIWQKR